MAGIALSKPKLLIVVVAPTGSGKTWVQGLIAKYYCRRDMKVTIVEPSDTLQQQTAMKLSPVDFRIDVTTIKRLYEDGGKADVIILNEYD